MAVNQRKFSRFIDLLRRQEGGSASAIDAIFGLGVTPEDGHCFYNLYGEWSGAFSYSPGRVEALRPIRGIAEAVSSFPRDDTLAMYELPEWGQLVDLRGPVEVVLLQRCDDCSRQFPAMGCGDFLDIVDLICRACGSVRFHGLYDDAAPPACACGSDYPPPSARGCPDCGGTDVRTIREQSPYEYFESHTFVRGVGA